MVLALLLSCMLAASLAESGEDAAREERAGAAANTNAPLPAGHVLLRGLAGALLHSVAHRGEVYLRVVGVGLCVHLAKGPGSDLRKTFLTH